MTVMVDLFCFQGNPPKTHRNYAAIAYSSVRMKLSLAFIVFIAFSLTAPSFRGIVYSHLFTSVDPITSPSKILDITDALRPRLRFYIQERYP